MTIVIIQRDMFFSGYFSVDESSMMGRLDNEVDGIQKMMDELYTTLLTLQVT